MREANLASISRTVHKQSMDGTRQACRIRRLFVGAGNSRITPMSKAGKSMNKDSPGVTITLTSGQSNSLEYFAVVSSQPLRLTGLDGRLIAYLVPSAGSGRTQKFTLTRLTANKARKLLLKSFERSATPLERKTSKSSAAAMP